MPSLVSLTLVFPEISIFKAINILKCLFSFACDYLKVKMVQSVNTFNFINF